MYNNIIILSIITLCLYNTIQVTSAKDYTVEITILHQNNTGAINRTRPVFICYPAIDAEVFPKCFLSSGLFTGEDDLITVFYKDLWRLNIDLQTKTASWVQLPFQNAPFLTQGGFHQYWRHNLTSFSWTAGLNLFNLDTFAGTCVGDQFITYDYKNLRFELTTPIGSANWKNTSIGSCSRYKDDVYCFGGINCTTFSDENLLWTKYNVPTNTITKLNSQGIANVISRELASITCIRKKNKCLIGSGQLVVGGTVDQWVYYNIKKDKFDILSPENQPVNLQYVSPDVAEEWEKSNSQDSGYKVIKNGPLIMTAGDNASDVILSSNTVRYLAQFDYKKKADTKFIQKPTGSLFTIKGQVLRNIPKFSNEDDDDDEDENNIIQSDKKCSYFVEYGGKEQNAQVPFQYLNQVVLFKVCKVNNDDEDDDE